MRFLYWLFSGMYSQRLYPIAPRRRSRSIGFLIGLLFLTTVLFLLLRQLYSYYLGAIDLPQ